MFILVALRRLAFLNTEGFDRFGNNELFAPLIKWETFKEQVVSIRDYARSYENAYNGIQASLSGATGWYKTDNKHPWTDSKGSSRQ